MRNKNAFAAAIFILGLISLLQGGSSRAQTTQCDWSLQYLKTSTSACMPRSYCFDLLNPEYKTKECEGVRGLLNTVYTTLSTSGTSGSTEATYTAPTTSSESGATSGTTYSGTTAIQTETAYTVELRASGAECGSGAIKLSWSSPLGSDGYKVLRDGTEIYSGAQTELVDKGLSPGKRYSYAVYSRKGDRASSASQAAEAPGPCPSTASTVETSLQTTVQTATSAIASTTDQTRTCDWSKEYLRSSTGSCSPRAYCFEPSWAEYGSGECQAIRLASGYSASDRIGELRELKAAPQSCGSDAIFLSWQPSEGALGYKAYRDGTIIYEGRNSWIYSTGLEPGKSYSYSVVAFNASRESVKASASAKAPERCAADLPSADPSPEKAKRSPAPETKAAPTAVTATATPSAPKTLSSTTPVAQTRQCDWQNEYLKQEGKVCAPRSLCLDEGSSEYGSRECASVRASFDAKTAAIKREDKKLEEASQKTHEIASNIEATRVLAEEAKKSLLSAIEKSVGGATTSPESVDPKKKEALEDLKERLVEKVEARLSSTALSPDGIESLAKEIDDGFREIDGSSTRSDDIARAFLEFDSKISLQREELVKNGGDLLYKDSNADGISDYDAIHLYGMDPEKPAPVSELDEKRLAPAEKILLGYDPAREDLVKIQYEEPKESFAPIVETYKVEEVSLAEGDKVVLKGRALPNTFVTLYIYSTPIVVVVKADEYGEWEYTLDKELETGEHTVYTASVNNSGKIVARGSAVPFIKTAEAATLDISSYRPATDLKPGLINARDMGAIAVALLGIVLISINLIGMARKKE
ncbi:MAG: hypothetical protein HZA81_02545 [Candidatus Taylorbacteria bacterium]|nr:hypothetical protein [Candidatus Taylorbacteria bacterium]